MPELFRLCLYTKQDVANEDTIAALWKLLEDPLIDPEGYGSTEDARLLFAAPEYVSAAAIYANEGTLFVRGKKNAFQVMFSAATPQVSTWNFYMDLEVMKGKKAAAWLNWFFMVCKAFPVLFGAGSSWEEYRAKHQVRVSFPDGGRTTKTLGVSVNELKEFLPGVYWLTIFGPQLVEHFGEGTLRSLPRSKATQIDSTQFAVNLDSPAKPENMNERLEIEREQARTLGAQFFFDRDNPDAKLVAVPQLQAIILS